MYCILKILNNNALLAKVKEDDREFYWEKA